MSKRQRVEKASDFAENSSDSGESNHGTGLSPLRSNLPPLDLTPGLSSNDLSFNPLVPLGRVPSPKKEFDCNLVDSSESDLAVLDVNFTSDVGPPLSPGNNYNDPFEATAAWLQDVPACVEASSRSQCEALTVSADRVNLPSCSASFETNLISTMLHVQPLPCIESSLPVSSFDDPSGIFGSYDGTQSAENEDLPFYDADDFSALFSVKISENQTFLEENDPTNQHLEEDNEDTGIPTLGHVTDLFFDAIDPQPLDNNDKPTCDPPLYDGATVSLNEALIAVLSFMLGCKVSGEVMEHLISLINMLLPPKHNFVKSLFSFNKYFEKIKAPLNLIYYCINCTQSLATTDSICDKCNSETKVGFYIHVPLIDQLRCLYARPGFVDLLSYRHRRVKKVPNNIEDIYDGSAYKSIESSLGLLDFTLQWNTDGISLYKSSSYQVWPMYFSINELPPELRYKEENLLLGGIAFGYEKPHANILMKPIYEDLKSLKAGVDVLQYGKEIPDKVKGFLLDGTADAPAKATFMRMTYFMGHHGCHCCYAKGEKSERTGNVFVYPYEEDFRPRSREEYCEDLKNQTGGIKGPTYLFWMCWSFFMQSTAVDVMHCVYLGVCRQLFNLWFSSEYFKHVFGENAEKKKMLQVLSKIFCGFRAPHYLSRPPRSLAHASYFKASEFRTWLFSTALPVFKKYMKEPYFEHFKKLVCAIGLLNQSSVSPADIQLSRELLISFVKQFQELFGLRNMSFNVHCLLHLPDTVLALGPLFVTSCFPFEGVNGLLARLVHGTRYAGSQIHSNLGLLRKIPSLINSLLNSAVKAICNLVMYHGNRLKVTVKLAAKTFIVGKILSNYIPSDPVFLDVLRRMFPISRIGFFFRLKKNGFLYVAEEYTRGIRDSSNVLCKFLNGEELFGIIKVFVRISDCKCDNEYCDHPSNCFAVIQKYTIDYPFTITSPAATISFIVDCTPTDDFVVVNISDLECVCFKMCTDTSTFLSKPLNYWEME